MSFQSQVTNINTISNYQKKPNFNPNGVYIKNSDKRLSLSFESVQKYVSTICNIRKLQHLDSKKVADNVYPNLKTINTSKDIEDQVVVSASELATEHYDYPQIAVYILIKNLHENTHSDYSLVVKQLRLNVDKDGIPSPIVNKGFAKFVKAHKKEINNAFVYDRDYDISIFGYRTLEKSYLKKSINEKIIERPQHLYMRTAICLHYRKEGINKILETYKLLSKGYFIHATPTLFNSGTIYEQLSSCFLFGIEDDMDSIGESWKDCGNTSKHSGGIGINVTNIRATGSYISSSQGFSNGLQVLTVFDKISRFANQGGKRSGSFAIYIEPWHADVFYFLDLKKNTGEELDRTRDLFLGLMINDIYMQRVEEDGLWSLMCPKSCKDLLNKYGKEFTQIYESYEKRGMYVKQVRARDLHFKIMETQIEAGMPYIIYKDAVNYKSNQINIGVINGSNLCAEILQYSSSTEYAVCNLCSICLPKYVKVINDRVTFNYNKLYKVVRIAARNLNNIIDINYYPVEKCRVSNMSTRPMGIGVQGLADVFAMFETPFDSPLARSINKKIFETIYFAAITESMELSKIDGPYPKYNGSPISKGMFQYNLWGLSEKDLSGMWDWSTLRSNILKYGVRNSLVTAEMPTASTSQINNNNECFEPFTQNIYTRCTLAGDFYVINKHLMKKLMSVNMWNADTIDLIKYYEGSIKNIPGIPDTIKEIYRTVWEIPQKSIIEMAADRGPFVDQTQSMNLHIAKPDFALLNSCLFFGWKLGLKTGVYYLRGKSSTEANQFGIDINKIKNIQSNESKESNVCKLLPKNMRQSDCIACSS